MQKLPSTVHPLKKAVLRFHISPVKWTAGCFHTSLWPVHKTYDSHHLLSHHPSDLLRSPDNGLLPAPVLVPGMELALDLTGAVLPPDSCHHSDPELPPDCYRPVLLHYHIEWYSL